jgi:spore maturation protein CgeB
MSRIGSHIGRTPACGSRSGRIASSTEEMDVLDNLHPAEMHGLNCRLFEATAAGRAVLCESRPARAELFDTDREVLAFASFGSCSTRLAR